MACKQCLIFWAYTVFYISVMQCATEVLCFDCNLNSAAIMDFHTNWNPIYIIYRIESSAAGRELDVAFGLQLPRTLQGPTLNGFGGVLFILFIFNQGSEGTWKAWERRINFKMSGKGWKSQGKVREIIFLQLFFLYRNFIKFNKSRLNYSLCTTTITSLLIQFGVVN